MLKFIPGILLIQIITIALVLISPADLENWGWPRLAIPVLIVGFLTAFWFGSIAAHQRKDEIGRLKDYHAKERETIRVNAERSKTKLLKQTQRKTLKEVRRSSRRSNIKIGLAFAGAAGLGVLLILTQFMSLGLLTLNYRVWCFRRLYIAYPAGERHTATITERPRYTAYHQYDTK